MGRDFVASGRYTRKQVDYAIEGADEDGRLSPNVNRFFDLPHAGFTVKGGPDNGLLPTDRPPALKFYGAYSLGWDKLGFSKNNTTEFQVFTTAQNGMPLTTTVDILNIDTIVLSKRGDLGRTQAFTQTDFAVRHRYKFGRDNKFTLVVESDMLNLFNEKNELSRNNLLSITNFDLTDPALGIITAAESTQPNAYSLALGRFQRNGAAAVETAARGLQYPLFNKANSFQAPRSIRFGIRLFF